MFTAILAELRAKYASTCACPAARRPAPPLAWFQRDANSHSRSEEARARAAKEAHQFVCLRRSVLLCRIGLILSEIAFQAREMSSEAFAKFLASISATISALAASTAVGDRLASLALIGASIACTLAFGYVSP